VRSQLTGPEAVEHGLAGLHVTCWVRSRLGVQGTLLSRRESLASPASPASGLVSQALSGRLIPIEIGTGPPRELRGALARTLGDPALEVVFWLPERETYADAGGNPVDLADDGARAVTYLDHEGEPLAAIVHDPSLLKEPKLVRAAGAAARLALENAQLQAETSAQLAEVKESRVQSLPSRRGGFLT